MLKYEKIARTIEEEITKHQFKEGQKLPKLETLMSSYDASKSTIMKALSLLEKKGLLYQVRGSGIFVRKQQRRGYIHFSNQGFSGELNQFDITAEVIQLDETTASEEVASNLNIQLGAPIHYVKRVRFINGQPLCIEESHFNKELIPYLNREIAAGSIFDYIGNGLGLKIGFSDMYLHIGKLSSEEAAYLKQEAGDPKLYVETNFFSE